MSRPLLFPAPVPLRRTFLQVSLHAEHVDEGRRTQAARVVDAGRGVQRADVVGEGLPGGERGVA